MELQQAKRLANHWKRLLGPSCERIEIAGSIRRGKPDPKDIEILCMPKLSYAPDLFGAPGTQVNALEDALRAVAAAEDAIFLKNGPRYKQIALSEGVHLDLFIVLPPAEWGVQMMIRTGPSDFSHWMVTPRHAGGGLPSNLKVRDGAIWLRERKIPTPEERDVFKILGTEYTEPSHRRAMWRTSRGQEEGMTV